MKRIRGWIRRHKRGLIVTVVILLCSGGIVYAAMKKISNSVEDSFSAAASVNPVIQETFVNYSDTEKTNVRINPGATDYPVHVRANVLVTWQDSTGKVYGTLPEEGEDYTLTINTGKWDYDSTDHFYYYRDVVQPNTSTQALVTSCEALSDGPQSGYTLSVDVMVQTIQAVGSTDDDSDSAMNDAWK